MAINKPVEDNARKGAVRKRSQLKTATRAKSTGRSAAGRPVNLWTRKKTEAKRLRASVCFYCDSGRVR